MKNTFCLLLISIFCSVCTAVRQPAGSGELTGYIYLLSGNQMPGPGRPQSKGRGVSRTVYIYAATSIKETTGASPIFTQIKTKLIAQTKSDSTGHYAIKLPAGKYSVFVTQSTHYFAAESDGNGTLNPIEIAAKIKTQKDFTITTNTAF